MSPALSRLMRSLVRRSIRAVPAIAVVALVLRRAMGPRLLEALACLEQLGGMAARVRGLPYPREHAGQLTDSLLTGHRLGARHPTRPCSAAGAAPPGWPRAGT